MSGPIFCLSFAVGFAWVCTLFAAHERGRRKGFKDAVKVMEPVIEILESVLTEAGTEERKGDATQPAGT
jgi:hypothetical protein